MFDQLGAIDRGNEQFRRVSWGTPAQVHRTMEAAFQDRTVDLSQLPFRGLLIHTNHDPVWVQKILNGCAFPQEFRVGGHTELRTAVAAVVSELSLQLLARLRRHRALLHYQHRRARFGGDQPRYVVNRRQVGVASLQRRRAHTNENSFGRPHRLSRITAERKSIGPAIRRQHAIQIRLVNRHHARLQGGDAFRVVICANDMVAELCQACSRHQTHISATNHRNSRVWPPKLHPIEWHSLVRTLYPWNHSSQHPPSRARLSVPTMACKVSEVPRPNNRLHNGVKGKEKPEKRLG